MTGCHSSMNITIVSNGHRHPLLCAHIRIQIRHRSWIQVFVHTVVRYLSRFPLCVCLWLSTVSTLFSSRYSPDVDAVNMYLFPIAVVSREPISTHRRRRFMSMSRVTHAIPFIARSGFNKHHSVLTTMQHTNSISSR